MAHGPLVFAFIFCFSLASGVCRLKKDSIRGMLNALVRVYITDDWKNRFDVYILHDLS